MTGSRASCCQASPCSFSTEFPVARYAPWLSEFRDFWHLWNLISLKDSSLLYLIVSLTNDACNCMPSFVNLSLSIINPDDASSCNLSKKKGFLNFSPKFLWHNNKRLIWIDLARDRPVFNLCSNSRCSLERNRQSLLLILVTQTICYFSKVRPLKQAKILKFLSFYLTITNVCQHAISQIYWYLNNIWSGKQFFCFFYPLKFTSDHI